MAILTVSKLYKRYSNNQVFSNFSFSLKKGERVGIVGPNGAGKTTLLKIIAGLEPSDSGSIRHKLDITVGMVFQEDRLLPWKTVQQNIELIARQHHSSIIQLKQAVNHHLTEMELTSYSDSYPNQLSGGLKQRASLARALVINPDLLLMDEPFSSLDHGFKKNYLIRTKQLLQKFRTTLLLVTHDQKEAKILTDRIISLDN